MLVARSRNSCLGAAEFAFFVVVVLFKDREPSLSPRFNLFVFDVNQGNEKAV